MASLIRFTSKTMGRPYRLGGYASEQGVDCFNYLWDFLSDKIDLPLEYEGFTIDTYADLYEKDPDRARRIMFQLFKDILIEISPHEVVAGDILRVRVRLAEAANDFPAIDGGNGNIVFVEKTLGASMWPKRFFIVREAYKWAR